MEQEQIIRKVRSIGNGAHVFAPKDWLNEEVLIVRISNSSSIKEQIIKILSDYSADILGLYLVGSYARSEQTEKSDIDVLAVTSNTNKKIKNGKYDIILISKNSLEKALKDNILPLLPMLREAKPLINSELIKSYKNTIITKENLNFHIETTKSAIKAVSSAMNLESSKVSDNLVYSLVLRLREIYILDCMIKNRQFSNREFSKLAENLGGKHAYQGYNRIKNNENPKKFLSLKEAENIKSYILKKIEEQEKWVKRKI